MDRVEEAFDDYMNAPTWYQETYGATAGRTPPHRLLHRRVRHPRERAGLLRRPRRAGRRPPQERQRPRPAARRRRPDVPRGLLPPVPQRGRLAAGALSRERLLQPAAHPRDRRRRHAAAGQRAVARPRGAGCASGASRSAACRSTCSTPTSRRTPPRTAASPPGSTAATTTCASARRSSSASAASAPCARWASRRPSAT